VCPEDLPQQLNSPFLGYIGRFLNVFLTTCSFSALPFFPGHFLDVHGYQQLPFFTAPFPLTTVSPILQDFLAGVLPSVRSWLIFRCRHFSLDLFSPPTPFNPPSIYVNRVFPPDLLLKSPLAAHGPQNFFSFCGFYFSS